MLSRRLTTTHTALGACLAMGLLAPLLVAPSASAITYRLTVTCSVPKGSPERQLAPNSCMNYMPDGTQTYTAHVTNDGHPVTGVTVTWSDSDSKDASFRTTNNPCVTGSGGTCSDELADKSPHAGEKITVTATGGGSTAKGYLTFR
jgi:hypothetical protein